MDGHVDAAVNRLGFLAGVDSVGGEAWVTVGEIVLFLEAGELDFGGGWGECLIEHRESIIEV